jgi:hypothetical protein
MIFLNALQELETQKKLFLQNIREHKPPTGDFIGFRKYEEGAGDAFDHQIHEASEISVEDDDVTPEPSGGGGVLFDFDDDET